MNKKIFSVIIGLSCCFSACSDWVDVKTKGSLVPEETENYRYLMNNTENFRWTLSTMMWHQMILIFLIRLNKRRSMKRINLSRYILGPTKFIANLKMTRR